MKVCCFSIIETQPLFLMFYGYFSFKTQTLFTLFYGYLDINMNRTWFQFQVLRWQKSLTKPHLSVHVSLTLLRVARSQNNTKGT